MFNGNEERNKLTKIDHIVMNLPASAVSFLSCFVGINNNNRDAPILPMIHCYGFAYGEKPDEAIIKVNFILLILDNLIYNFLIYCLSFLTFN